MADDTSDFFSLLTPLRDTECGLFWDPYLRAFSGAHGTILLPCKFFAAHLRSDVINTTSCVTAVLAFGLVGDEGVYTGAAEINIQVLTGNAVTHSINLVISDGILKISSSLGTRVLNIPWGKSNKIQIGTVTVKWIFNGPYLTLSAPVCGVSLVYRTISVKFSEIIIQTVSRRYISPLGYPDYTFCGNATNGRSMFEDDRVFLNLDSIKEVLAYRMLSSSVREQLLIPSLTSKLHPNYELCENARRLFLGCRSNDKERAIKNCLDIFSQKRLLICLSASSAINPMIIFNTCLSMECNPSSANCNSFKEALGRCIEEVDKPQPVC